MNTHYYLLVGFNFPYKYNCTFGGGNIYFTKVKVHANTNATAIPGANLISVYCRQILFD